MEYLFACVLFQLNLLMHLSMNNYKELSLSPLLRKFPICHQLKETQNENRNGWHCVLQLFPQTRDANYSGRRELAETNSKTARTLNHVGVGLGLISLVVFIIYYVMVLNDINKMTSQYQYRYWAVMVGCRLYKQIWFS